MRRFLFLFSYWLLLGSAASAQDAGDYEYNSEWAYGLGKNTRGGLLGHVFLRHSRAYDFPFLDKLNKNHVLSQGAFLFGQVEIGNIKHPQELRTQTPTTTASRPYIYGKSRYLYSIRTLIGAEKIVFRKGPKQGVQVSLAFSAGPVFGYSWPYYIEYVRQAGQTGVRSFEPFDSQIHTSQNNILGAGRLFQGMSEGTLHPGLGMKLAVNIEFGTYKSAVSGFDFGLQSDFYFTQIGIVETRPNRATYPIAFVSLYFGTRN